MLVVVAVEVMQQVVQELQEQVDLAVVVMLVLLEQPIQVAEVVVVHIQPLLLHKAVAEQLSSHMLAHKYLPVGRRSSLWIF